MYEVSMRMVQMYAKHNIGKRSVTVDMEEDQFRDILTLMELLTNILSKDVIDFGDPGEKRSRKTDLEIILQYPLTNVSPLTDLILFADQYKILNCYRAQQ